MDTTTTLVPEKEIQETNKQVMDLQKAANLLTIKSPDDLGTASDLLELIKNAERSVVSRKEEITRPLMRGLSAVRDLFKPVELGLDNAKKIAKAKVVAFQTLEEQKNAEEKAKIEARVEKGTLKLETGLKKLAEVGDVPKTVGAIKMRTLTKVRVVDETLIPREYLVPDMTKITEAVLRQNISVPGVEKYQDKIVAV